MQNKLKLPYEKNNLKTGTDFNFVTLQRKNEKCKMNSI
jgi:hypothetical protein